jgi:hypothetical protein
MQLQTAPVADTGPEQTVLAATMNNDFSVFPEATFPAYTLTRDRSHQHHGLRNHHTSHQSICQSQCAVYWPPVLTTGRPQAGPGINPDALWTVNRPDGTQQVTYHRRAHPIRRVQHHPTTALTPPPPQPHPKPRPTPTDRGFLNPPPANSPTARLHDGRTDSG